MQDVARAIVEQPMTTAARKLAIVQIQMASWRAAAWTQPISLLTAVDAVLADDLELLLDAVDDDADLFARDPSVRRAGYPRGLLEEMFAGAWAA